ncbi:MAG: beta strand repeat-containing protein, partial [Cytophagaceae bacterium]
MKNLYFLRFCLFKILFLLCFLGEIQGATYNVTLSGNNNWDPVAAGSLRWAIQQANANPGPHTITFAVSSIVVENPASVTLTRSDVTFDGTSAPGYATCGLPVLVITGPGYNEWSFNNVSNVVVRGIILNNWRIALNGGSNNAVYQCNFNINAAGNASVNNDTPQSILINGSNNNTIGGTTCSTRNVFAGGVSRAIVISGSSTGNLIIGNYIGTNRTGNASLGTIATYGIEVISSNSNKIDRNIIGSCSGAGIYVTGSTPDSIKLNHIGIGADGTSLLATRNGIGIQIVNSQNARVIGNVVVGSSDAGIFTSGAGNTNGIVVRNNYVGIRADGVVSAIDYGNRKSGIYLTASSNSIIVENNVICDNGQGEDLADNSGIYIFAQNVAMSNLTVSNNRVGVDINNAVRGNDFSGIYMQRFGTGTLTSATVSGNIVGDNGNGFPNKKSHGISFRDMGPATVGNLMVTANYVGVTPTNTDIGNYGNGIEFYGVNGFTASGNIIGFNKFATTVAGGWAGGGIMVNGSSSNGLIIGNYIGETSTGTNIGNRNPANPVYPNQMAGICIEQSSNITIGGTGATDGNIIKNNNWGIQLVNIGASRSNQITIQGNNISNQTSHGIYIPGGNNNLIGGTTAAASNTISNNGGSGIFIINTTSTNNQISRNSISCNTAKGINLNYGVSQGNNGLAAPIITSVASPVVSGTATPNGIVQVFVENSSCFRTCEDPSRRQGAVYLGQTTADGSGNWTYTHGLALPNTNVTATVTAAGAGNQNTSEFSTCNIQCISAQPNISPGGPTTFCQGGSVTLTASSADGDATFVWSTGASGNSITISTAGTYTVTATKPGCTGTQSGSITITVNPNPGVPTAGSNTPVCTGNAINLTANSSGATSYSWTGPGGFTSTDQNPTRNNATTAMAGTYEVRGIAAGCSSAVAQTIVVVNTTPGNPNASSNTPVCTGATLQLNAASAGA